ncbi:hypothetical protein HK405_013187 [Cladochytrium tenue]|nr:hypothetical protein HK405_013187 [Cladochytrium tenue]
MNVVVAGASGFLGTELVRQALLGPCAPRVASVVALARRPVADPRSTPDTSTDVPATPKFKSVVCTDFEHYPDSVLDVLRGADACIWTIGVTPTKARGMAWEEVCKISRDYAVTAVDTISKLAASRDASDKHRRPVRFVYISGVSAERDQSKKPWVMPEMLLMRGEAETLVLESARRSDGVVEACVAKPGYIGEAQAAGGLAGFVGAAARALLGVPSVGKAEIAAALLDQCARGFESDTLTNADLVRIGRRSLAPSAS